MRNHRMVWRLLFLICVICTTAAAQSTPTRKDIPTIAKTAKGAIVTIVMANDDKPIVRGTGFLVSPDGAIVTNYHVIATGNVAVVKFADGTVLPIDGVLAADKVSDLAILKIHGKAFPTLTLGNSDQIQVGEEVVAIGNPLGLELTVSNGIVSGIRTGEKQEDKLLQITAPISHGSSGGPLFSMSREVVGINALYLEGGESLNFAIPVNDVKNLLHNQSAQLQELPNEANTNKPEPNAPKPDASTGAASDTVLPSKTKSGSDQRHSYYIRALQHGTYIIEHDGRQFAATCRENLRWVRGTDKPGWRLRDEHDCGYMSGLVGQHIPAKLVWQQSKELRYEPFVGLEVYQDADVLDIVAEAPAGSLLRRSSPKTSPEILKTLHWIQNTLAAGGGTTTYSTKEEEVTKRKNLLLDVNGCQVTFVYAIQGLSPLDETFHSRSQVNLGDLDPASLEVGEGSHDDIGPLSLVMVDTTDKVPAVRSAVNDRNWEPAGATASSTNLMWELPSPYAARFAKALKHAITLCGGKPSSF